MTDQIDLLDHGFVRLDDSMGSDTAIAKVARESHDQAAKAGVDPVKDAKLIRRLWLDQHTSPFETVVLRFEVRCPIYVARQWMRHRTWAYSELSARYREVPERFYVPAHDMIGVQDKDNHQGRNTAAIGGREYDVESVILHNEDCAEFYRFLLHDQMWPRELARGVLPLATYTHFFATVNLLNLLKFLRLRLASDSQYEIRVYAEALLELVRPVAPAAVGAFEEGLRTERTVARLIAAFKHHGLDPLAEMDRIALELGPT